MKVCLLLLAMIDLLKYGKNQQMDGRLFSDIRLIQVLIVYHLLLGSMDFVWLLVLLMEKLL
jgi:hypothetical protein